jgi:hypothetical protein
MDFLDFMAQADHERNSLWYGAATYRSAGGESRVSKRRGEMRLVNLIAALSCVAALTSASADDVTPPRSAAAIPDFSGLWARQSFGFERPASGLGPLPSKGGRDVAGLNTAIGDDTNPMLTPEAAEVVKKRGEIFLSGVAFPTPSNQCYPYPPPYILAINQALEFLQLKDELIILHMFDNQTRRVRLNASHPAHVTPSWYGDSVGRYDGDTLVIDTVGVRVTPFGTLDRYGTPYSGALHIVERYRLIANDAAQDRIEEVGRLNGQPPTEIGDGVFVDRNYKGKGLQVEFTIEDPNVFTKPWSAIVTYLRAAGGWVERICAENTHVYYSQDTAVPTAEKPDF